ncbi:MAG: HlyD family efflux transporter periplasmic adaptor subunit [Alphaproteobacteria bacterium]
MCSTKTIIGLIIFCGFSSVSVAFAQKLVVQGYIEGKFIRMAPAVSGRIETFSVKEGDKVTAGQDLFVLENKREVALRDAAKSQLEQAQEILEDLEKERRPEEIAASEAALEQAKATLSRSKNFLERQEKLMPTKAISQQQLDDARAAYEEVTAHVNELTANLAVAHLPSRIDQVEAAKATVKANTANLESQQWPLDQKNVKAPVEGVVFEKIYKLGEWVAAGSPVLTLLPTNDTKVRFFVPQTALTNLQLNTKVLVTIDGRPLPITALITFISPQAQYTPPFIYSKEQRSKFVYLIEAEPAQKDKAGLHPGQPVDVELW